MTYYYMAGAMIVSRATLDGHNEVVARLHKEGWNLTECLNMAAEIARGYSWQNDPKNP